MYTKPRVKLILCHFHNFLSSFSKLQGVTQFHSVATSKQKHPAGKKCPRKIVIQFTELIRDKKYLVTCFTSPAKTTSLQSTHAQYHKIQKSRTGEDIFVDFNDTGNFEVRKHNCNFRN